jgi:VIT1/CCC1 family predicted Fe2+/Mn2+ transporter
MLPHTESHRSHHVGWLRAAVLGANDGAISTASLVVGVAAAQSNHSSILVAGLAGLAAGAMAMAAGEYVSVSSQADTEKADLARERRELSDDPAAETKELAAIYRARGLTQELADAVAKQLMQGDALAAHARDELGIIESQAARPLQAALTSAAMFSIGAVVPLAAAWISPARFVIPLTIITTLIVLLILGAVAARVGGAPLLVGAMRVAGWGAVAMAVTAGVGRLFHVAM